MPDGYKPVNLTTLHDEIKIALDAFTGLNSQFYGREKRRHSCPAIFFELDAITPEDSEQTATEQTPVLLNFSVYLIESYREENARLKVRIRAAELAAFIQTSAFAETLSNALKPTFEDAQPDEVAFSPVQSENQYECFRVDFSLMALLGESIIDDSGTMPETVFAGYEPKTGAAHVDDYSEVEQAPI